MSEHRAYIVGPDGRFQDFKIITATDDEDAVGEVMQIIDGRDIELWQLDRKVAVFPHKD